MACVEYRLVILVREVLLELVVELEVPAVMTRLIVAADATRNMGCVAL